MLDIGICTIWLGRDGVLREMVREGVAFDVEKERRVLAAMRQLTGGRRAPMVTAMEGYANAEPEARRFWGGPEVASTLIALALIVHSPVMRVVGSFFARVSRASYPVRLFEREDAAVAWARTHVER